jgi:hypothetical protein
VSRVADPVHEAERWAREYPVAPVVLHDHHASRNAPGFAKDHRQEAVQVDATCTACHDRSTCIACHQGVVKPTDFHPGNYTLTHAVEARRGTPDCSACHRAQSFCVGCHERSGITQRGSTDFSSADPQRAFHPAGWASQSGGSNEKIGGKAGLLAVVGLNVGAEVGGERAETSRNETVSRVKFTVQLAQPADLKHHQSGSVPPTRSGFHG